MGLKTRERGRENDYIYQFDIQNQQCILIKKSKST